MFKKYSTLILLILLALFGLGGVFAFVICHELKDYFIQFYCAVLCGIFTFVSLYVTFSHEKKEKEEEFSPQYYIDKFFDDFDSEITFSDGNSSSVSFGIIKIVNVGNYDFEIDKIIVNKQDFLKNSTSLVKKGVKYLIKVNQMFNCGADITMKVKNVKGKIEDINFRLWDS